MTKDLRPDPKPRKHPELWQWYLTWEEWVEMRKRREARLRDIEKGKSNLDADIAKAAISGQFSEVAIMSKTRTVVFPTMDQQVDLAAAEMAAWGMEVGPVWDWLNSIRGIGPNLAAKLLALVDDIAKFQTISKLWRFSGHGIYEYWVDADGAVKAPKDGWKDRKAKKGEWVLYGQLVESDTPFAREAIPDERVRVYTIAKPQDEWELKQLSDRNVEGWCSCQNKILKSVVWQCGDSFIKQRAEPYRTIYDNEKVRLRMGHPERIKTNGRIKYNDGHLHNMAMRKMRKIFLQHLWLVWRESEGLPVSEPWIIAIGGHQDIIPPPNWPMESRGA